MIYAISDIHGQYEAFIDILDQIKLTQFDTIYFLGDYVDWGEDSIKVIDKCMQLEEKGLAKCLIGNHDLMFLNQLKKDISRYGYGLGKSLITDNCIDSCWSNNGGLETYYDYSLLEDKHKEKIYNWLDNLPYTVEAEINNKNVLFSHSVPFTQFNKNDSNYIYSREQAVWDRSLIEYSSEQQIEFINKKEGFKIASDSPCKIYDYYVHGHTPTDDFKIKANDYEVNVDCCAKLLGYNYDERCCLACINLSTKEIFYSKKY